MMGFFSGYRLIHLEVFGFSLERIGGHLRVRRYKGAPIGQCMMYTENESNNPILFVAGGMILNLISAVVFMLTAVFVNSFPFKLILLIEGSLNFSVAVFNLFFGSEYSDGKTLKEIRNGGGVPYNRIMLIAKFLREGKSYTEMPGEIFINTAKNTSVQTLEKDMEMHRVRYLIESREKSGQGSNDIKFERLGEPVRSLTENALRDYKKRSDFERIFKDIINSAKKSMYPGEYLSAARCFASLKDGL